MGKCTGKTEVYTRCCGFYRPVNQMNLGKREEIKDRKGFNIEPLQTKRSAD